MFYDSKQVLRSARLPEKRLLDGEKGLKMLCVSRRSDFLDFKQTEMKSAETDIRNKA